MAGARRDPAGEKSQMKSTWEGGAGLARGTLSNDYDESQSARHKQTIVGKRRIHSVRYQG